MTILSPYEIESARDGHYLDLGASEPGALIQPLMERYITASLGFAVNRGGL